MDFLPYDDGAWAGEFCRIAREKGHHLDMDWVRSWFKGALQRGYDEGVSVSLKAPTLITEKPKSGKK